MMMKSEMKLYNIDNDFEKSLISLHKMYSEGKVFILPTDIVYCIAGNPFNEKALNRLKSDFFNENDFSNPTLLIDSISNLLKFIDIESERHLDLLISLWPNPIDVVFNLNLKYRAILGFDKAAFRIPNHRFCLRFLTEIKSPVFIVPVNLNHHFSSESYEILKDKYQNKIDGLYYSNKESFYFEPSVVDLCSYKPFLIKENKIKLLDILDKYS